MTDTAFPKRTALYSGEHRGIHWEIYQAPITSVLNGYARIPDGVEIDADEIDIHGDITYGSGRCTGWIGFDTSHAGDWWDLAELREQIGVHVTEAGEMFNEFDRDTERQWPGFHKKWTLDGLKDECRRLCDQIADHVEKRP